MPSIQSASGAWNVTAVAGTSWTGLYALDGSFNVVEDTGSTWKGMFHACGALNVKVVSGTTYVGKQSANGSMNVYIGTASAAAPCGAQAVAVVSGALGSLAESLAASETQGIFIDGTDLTMVVRDTGTPANAFSGNPNSKLTYTSPSTKWIRNSAGLLESGTTLRTEYDNAGLPIGIRLEGIQATNLALHSDDFTNAVWTKSNLTAAKTATGPDGVANSASTLTATAGNATALQAITSGSSARVTSCYIKRRTGSGVVNVTQDNGTTWSAVTVTTAWTRVEIAAQTLTNPIVGIRLVTSGDEVDVAFFQHETGSLVSSPIRTTSATVTRASDNITLALASFSWSSSTPMSSFFDAVNCDASVGGTVWALGTVASGELRGAYFTGGSLYHFEYDGFVLSTNGGPVANTAANSRNKAASRFKLNDFRSAVNSTFGSADTSGTLSTPTQPLRIGGNEFGGSFRNFWLKQFLLVPREMLDAELQSRTT